MFNFLEKIMKHSNKDVEGLTAPIDGRVIGLSEVEDEVFSQGLVGDGVAIESTGNIIKAPADGELKAIVETNHAFAMTLDNGLDVLVHIGIDTVKLKGEGFKKLVKVGERIKNGQPIIEISREIIEGKGYSLVTPVLVTNMEVLDGIDYINVGEKVLAGCDKVVQFKFK